MQHEGQMIARLWKALKKVAAHDYLGVSRAIDETRTPEDAAGIILSALNSLMRSEAAERLAAAERALARRHIDAEIEARVAQQARDELGVIAVNRRDRIINLEAALRTAIKALELRDDGEASTKKILEVMKGYLDGTKGLNS